MSTKGYNSYRGRISPGRVILIVVLALILLGAGAVLMLQNYMVYDDDGGLHLELPFFQKTEQPDDGTRIDGEGDLVEIVVPEHPHVQVAALHATRLPDDCLWWDADYILTRLVQEDFVLAVKRTTGGITYGTSVETPAGVTVETGRTMDCLNALLDSGRHSVAHIVCFRDSAYSRARTEAALVQEDGSLWYDAEGQSWLDPTSPEVLQYITALVRECGELGFDEILLDQFCYPGDTEAVDNDSADKAQVLTDFAETLRDALPEDVALSVVVRDGQGLTAAELAELFDRLYVPAESDLAAVKDALPEGYDPETRVVAMTTAAAAGGSYMIVSGS